MMVGMFNAAQEERELECILDSKEPTMSSKQIAELLDLRHDNVKRTMERLLDRGVINFTPMEENPTGQSGRPGTLYLVNEDDSITTVAQLSPELTARIVKEWRRLRGENEDLKALVFEQGKKLDILCDMMMHPQIVLNPMVPEDVQTKGHKGKRMVRNYDVLEIKALDSQKKRHIEIALATGFCVQTVRRVIKGERDYLLTA